MTPPRPKQEYEEREADESGTPFERFNRAMKKIMGVSKQELERREREAKEHRAASS